MRKAARVAARAGVDLEGQWRASLATPFQLPGRRWSSPGQLFSRVGLARSISPEIPGTRIPMLKRRMPLITRRRDHCRLVQESGNETPYCPHGHSPVCLCSRAAASTPETYIDSGPTGTSTSTSASFSFHASKPATFRCSLDGATYQACTSPKRYMVGLGSHTFRVFAVDKQGRQDPSPASRSWTVVDSPTPASASVGFVTPNEGGHGERYRHGSRSGANRNSMDLGFRAARASHRRGPSRGCRRHLLDPVGHESCLSRRGTVSTTWRLGRSAAMGRRSPTS